TDIRQELFFRLAQPHELFGVSLPLGNVTAVENQSRHILLELKVDGVELEKPIGLVLAKKLKLDLLGVSPSQAAFELCAYAINCIGMDEVEKILANKGARPIPQ